MQYWYVYVSSVLDCDLSVQYWILPTLSVILYIHTVHGDLVMSDKHSLGSTPIINGLQRFRHHGYWVTVCYWGYGLDSFQLGDRVFFQNASGMYWLGTILRASSDCFTARKVPASSLASSCAGEKAVRRCVSNPQAA